MLKKMKKRMVIIGCVALFCIIFTSCASDSIKSDSSGTVSLMENLDEVESINDIVVNTDYGDLYYPEQWGEWLVTEQSKEDESLVVSFSALINDVEYLMFQVTIGNSDDVKVGEITDHSGMTRTVYMRLMEIEESDELTASEQQRLYAMQEDLNYLIDNLK